MKRCPVCCRAEGQNGYQTLPEHDEEQGKGPASSQGEAEAYREEVLSSHSLFDSEIS